MWSRDSRQLNSVFAAGAFIFSFTPVFLLPTLGHADGASGDVYIQTEVSQALFESGKQANDALNRLQAERAKIGAPIADAPVIALSGVPDALKQPVTLKWSGRADDLVKQIANSVGYTYTEVGPVPAAPSVVTMVFQGQPAIRALQLVGLRVNHTAQVSVDAATHTVTYRRIERDRGIAGSLMPADVGGQQ